MSLHRRVFWPAWGAGLIFAASAATLAATLVARLPLLPMHELREYHLLTALRNYRFFDLGVYRRAAAVVVHGRPLYTTRLSHGLGFTYPPVAVLMFLCLRWLSPHSDRLAVTIINIALVAAIAAAALRLPRSPLAAAPAESGSARVNRGRAAGAWLAAAVALWVEPVTTALGYGQIDLLITALVVVDLVYGRRSRAGGLGIGLAAALKLTPLIFIPYLVLTGRGRMAMRALAAFALSIAVALVVLPGDAATYWFGGKFMDVSRVTGGNHLAGAGAANQSLRGAVLRLLPGAPHAGLIWLAAALIVGAAGLLLAVRAARRGDEAWGFLLTALCGLLISPVSWTHHWTIAVAGVMAILGSEPRSLRKAMRVGAAVGFGLSTSVIWIVIRHPPAWQHVSTERLLIGNLYVLAAVGVIGTAAFLELRLALRGRGRALAHGAPPAGRPALAPTPQLITATAGDPVLAERT